MQTPFAKDADLTREAALSSIKNLAFETERLRVQHWQKMLDDPPARERLVKEIEPLLQPDVLRDLPPSMHLGDAPGAICNWVEARAAESECYHVTRRVDGDLLGLLILVEDTSPTPVPTLHIGYLFAQTAWGQGFATELLGGVLDVAKRYGPLCLMGGVAQSNPVSAHILRKLGFEKQPDLSTSDTEIFKVHVA